MVEVVFAEVVLGEVSDVCGLHVRDVGGTQKTDIHGDRLIVSMQLRSLGGDLGDLAILYVCGWGGVG